VKALRSGVLDPFELWEGGSEESTVLPHEFLEVAAAPSSPHPREGSGSPHPAAVGAAATRKRRRWTATTAARRPTSPRPFSLPRAAPGERMDQGPPTKNRKRR
jgi:hypothetical protein